MYKSFKDSFHQFKWVLLIQKDSRKIRYLKIKYLKIRYVNLFISKSFNMKVPLELITSNNLQGEIETITKTVFQIKKDYNYVVVIKENQAQSGILKK